MPATEPGEGEISMWYALEDDEGYKGFMEVTQYDDISEITYFMVPDIYKGNGYANRMLEEFLSVYIPESTPDSMLTTAFDYNVGDGLELADIFESHGFDINIEPLKECTLPFDSVYKKLSMKKSANYDGEMVNLVDGYLEVIDAAPEMVDSGITVRDIREASMELSVAALTPDNRIEALMLASKDVNSNEVVVNNLYTATEDPTVLRKFLSFAVENASTRPEVPGYITFVAANERLEAVMDSFFDYPKASELIIAEGEFNLGKYLEQQKMLEAFRRKQ